MDAARLLDGLNPAQLAAVESEAAPLCILAGAGSGKTRVLTRRIGHRVAQGTADARHTLALTFTRKAAGELNSRLRQLGLRDPVAAGTFHSVAYAQLRSRWADRDINPPSLLDRKVGFVARLVPRDVQAIDVVTEIEWAKARRIAPSSYVEGANRAARNPPVAPALVADCYARYEQAKRDQRLVDFDDLLRLAIRDLEGDPEFAAAQRWRFRHLFVDEFQDVNQLQFDLLRAWLGDRPDLCVVGDPNQAIYAWNGADARYLDHFEKWFPGGEQVQLTENYRSTPQILAVANAVLAPARPRSGPLSANRAEGPPPKVRRFATDTDEAKGIARSIRDHHGPGDRWSNQAVLVRTNAQAVIVGEGLRSAGIPHRVRGGTPLLEQPEIRTALAGLRRHRGPFHASIADLAATIEPDEPPSSAVDATDTTSADEASDTSDAVAQRRANLELLVRLADDYQRIDPIPRASSFLEWLRATVSTGEVDRDAVDVTTFHAAKGLEWPVVHLAGLETGLVPIGHAKTDTALAEERRLFYVAVTRAEQHLLCSYAQQRTFGQRTVSREPSPYLDAIEIAASLDGTPTTDWGRFIQEQRRSIDTPSRDRPRRRSGRAPAGVDDLDADEVDTFEALRAWRAIKAKAAKVPAYVIFSDATLVAITQAKPRTPRDLLQLPGIGPVKVERHGPEVLSVLHGDD